MINLSKQLCKHKLLIPYITLGDPDMETCENLICDMADCGADAVILGLPFSDPIAESEIITCSSVRAYSAGVDADKIFNSIVNVRARSDVYLILATYANIPFCVGVEKFIKRMKSAGVDGLIVYDAPQEEKEEFALPCARAGISYISQAVIGYTQRAVTKTKTKDGFLYCLPQKDVITDKDISIVKGIKAAADMPCLIALDNPDEKAANAAAEISDGIIVESGVVRIIHSLGKKCAKSVQEYIRALKSAICG